MKLIYTMTFASGAVYVGSTKRFSRRRHAHRHDLRAGRGINAKVRAEYAASGMPQFDAVACLVDGPLHELEAQVIASLAPQLNMSEPVPLPSSDRGPRRSFGPYETIADFASASGVSYNTAKRYSAKYSYEAALYKIAWMAKEPESVRRKRELTERATSLAANMGVSMDSAYGYLSAYKTTEAASAAILKKRNRMPTPAKYLTWDGKNRKLNDWAADNGVSKNVLYQRIHMGWPPEQACGLVPRPKQPRGRRLP